MKERPIIFNAPMVRAILEGRKTQTRRIVKPQPPSKSLMMQMTGDDVGLFFYDPEKHWRACGPVGACRDVMGDNWPNGGRWDCPFGLPGDRLYVKEKWATAPFFDGMSPSTMERMAVESGMPQPWVPLYYFADDCFTNWSKPDWGAYVGRHRSSIHMPRWASRITLEITGIRVERLQRINEADARAEGVTESIALNSFVDSFYSLWESIYGAGSWAANPWVWVIEFQRVGGGES